MSNDYLNVSNLEEIIEKAESIVGDRSYEINMNLKVKLDIDVVKKPIKDVTEDALDFQKKECPKTLHMNHGEYIHKKGNGIEEVIRRLKENPTGNRAIISLINQEDIVGSEDSAIPSFLILQFTIEENELYVTTYFRALEVTKFLRVNVEEIRLIVEEIKSDFLDLESVKLNIIAFKAYKKDSFSNLKKAEIDNLDQIDLHQYLVPENSEKLISMLEEKKQFSTIIEFKSIENILKWIDNDESNKLNPNLKKDISINYLKDIVDLLSNLKKLRTKHSHHKTIDVLQNSVEQTINDLIEVLRDES